MLRRGATELKIKTTGRYSPSPGATCYKEVLQMVVSWFSAGVSSAVATKLLIKEIDKIIYTHIDDQHPDTMRFVKDCEKWFGKEIEIIQSPYLSVENACRAASYLSGVRGAACSRLLKRRVRKEWEMDITESLTYVWGYDSKEKNRVNNIIESVPNIKHIFPLMDKNINKTMAHKILRASAIKRPAMYDLGFNNNNCLGCLRGGKKYWGKIRRLFPDIFEKRAKLERLIGASCINGTFLDELPARFNGDGKVIVDDCGVLCEALSI